MALRFTAEGAVGAPTTVQLRVGPGRGGGVRIGVPVPTRPLERAEVLDNARHFRNPGPRAAPAERVVLSAIPDDWLTGIGTLVDELHQAGFTDAVVHLDPVQAADLSGPLGRCDLVVTTPDPAKLARVTSRVPLAIGVPLLEGVLDRLEEVLAEVAELGPQRVTFVWPFPDGTPDRPRPAALVARTLAAHLGGWRAASYPWGIKGLPRCALSALEGVVDLDRRIWRTRNRYYVDADHQLGGALMFEPDLVRLVKSDRCRFCAVDARCDGVAARWLAEGLVPPLTPLEEP